MGWRSVIHLNISKMILMELKGWETTCKFDDNILSTQPPVIVCACGLSKQRQSFCTQLNKCKDAAIHLLENPKAPSVDTIVLDRMISVFDHFRASKAQESVIVECIDVVDKWKTTHDLVNTYANREKIPRRSIHILDQQMVLMIKLLQDWKISPEDYKDSRSIEENRVSVIEDLKKLQ